MTAGAERGREPDSELVSIIMPTYNCGAFIGETIASVQAQTHSYWELLVVDDCSTDDTAEVVAALAENDPRIHYVRLETNSGAAVARNRAMGLAQGRYMAFLDSDDLWHPDKLRRQIDFMTSRGVAMSCTAYAQIDEQARHRQDRAQSSQDQLQPAASGLPGRQLDRHVRRGAPGEVRGAQHQEAQRRCPVAAHASHRALHLGHAGGPHEVPASLGVCVGE